MAPRELWLVLAAVLLCQFGVFYLQAARCELADRRQLSIGSSSGSSSGGGLRALVVTDVHLLGKRRRSAVERAWIDWQARRDGPAPSPVNVARYLTVYCWGGWQVKQSVAAAVAVHRPDVVLVLGDQLDEGSRPTADADWAEYVDRFFAAFASVLPLQTLYLVGNHDASFGRFMSAAEVQRYEVTFGPANRVEIVDGHAFVSLNTMALDSDVGHKDVQTQARSFLEDVDFERVRARATGQVVLLTHVPLFREDDLACGAERRREGGHVTYERPEFRYAEHHHVLSRALSAELLATVRPDVVLSGHTHAWCARRHAGGNASEFTVPAFSWGQRPDPSYALVHFREAGEAVVATRCALPYEPLVFATYALALALVALSTLLRCCRGGGRGPVDKEKLR